MRKQRATGTGQKYQVCSKNNYIVIIQTAHICIYMEIHVHNTLALHAHALQL